MEEGSFERLLKILTNFSKLSEALIFKAPPPPTTLQRLIQYWKGVKSSSILSH